MTLAVFVAVPFLYAGLNFLTAPSATSLDTLWDGHAREQERDSYLGMRKMLDTALLRRGEAELLKRGESDKNDFTRHIIANGTKGSASKGLEDSSKQISKE